MEEKKYLDYQGLQTYHENLLSVLENSEQATAEALDNLDDRLKIIENKSPYSKSEIDDLLDPITDKLNTIEEFAEVNVLSDWNETNSNSDAYIKNKPNVEAIEDKIPSTASSTNQLADKEFVNSSISTSTATFRGTSATGLTEQQFLTWANGLTKDANDYVFWNTADAAGTPQFKRYKYNGSAWVYEYTLNNSSFTADQWATINSLLTSSHKDKLDALPTNTELTTLFAGKEDVINDLATIRSGAAAGATAYQKPSTGIPSSDMTSAVQTSLGKADSAYQKPTTGIPSTDLASGVQTSLGKADTAIQSDDLATVATTGSYNDLVDKPTIPAAQIQSDWNQADNEAKDFIKNKPTIPTVPTNVSAFTNDAGYLTQHQDISGKANSADLATVATSGSYNDLSNKPTIPAAQIQSDWNQTDNTAKDFIKNKPTIVPAEVEIVADDTATIAADTKIVIEEDTDGLDTLVYTKAQTDSAINTRIQEVIGAAPAALDTLEEIAAKLGDDDSAISAITNTLSLKANSADLATVATSGSYNDLSNKPTIPTIPTNVSAFTNDAGYLTSETPEVQINGTPASGIKLLVDETADASVEVYSKAQVDAMIANIYLILINNGLTV